MGPAPGTSTSREGDPLDHIVSGGVDSQHSPVAEDPDASRAHLDVGGRDAESDRAYVQGSRIDPQESVVVPIPDPDRPFPNGGSRRFPSNGNLADDRVRSRVNDCDGLACELHGRR